MAIFFQLRNEDYGYLLPYTRHGFCERQTMCKDFSISKKIFQENSQLSQQFCKLIRVHGESKKSWNGKTEHKKT
jgi:hypothetical protein